MLGLLLLLGAAACSAPVADETISAETASTETTAETQGAETTEESTPELTEEPVVVFTDDVLEEMVRDAMGMPEGDITIADAEEVTELDLNMFNVDWSVPRIEDLSSLQYFTNLTSLNLNQSLYNEEGSFDISPLAGLTKLETLAICCDGVDDISELSGLVNMKNLEIWGEDNEITDFSPLYGMTQMEDLWLQSLQLSDISFVADMPNLWFLNISYTQVTDLTPLSGLTNLRCLYLEDIPTTDYSPLEDIYPNLEDKDFEMD